MPLTFREARPSDIPGMFSVRGRTRENAFSAGDLAALGITPQSAAQAMRQGRTRTWLCHDGAAPVGFCSGDAASGEVLVVAVLPQYENRGIGRALLQAVVEALAAAGQPQPWLAASPDPGSRAYGFYRALGWRPTGERDERGDQILRHLGARG